MNEDYPFSFQGRPTCNMRNIFTTLRSVVDGSALAKAPRTTGGANLAKRGPPNRLGSTKSFKRQQLSLRNPTFDNAARYPGRSILSHVRLGLGEPTEEDKWRIQSSQNNFKSILMKKKLVRHGVLMKNNMTTNLMRNNMTAYRRHFSPPSATQKKQMQIYPTAQGKTTDLPSQNLVPSYTHNIPHTTYVLQTKQPEPLLLRSKVVHMKTQQKYTQQKGSIKDYIPPSQIYSDVASHLSLFSTEGSNEEGHAGAEPKTVHQLEEHSDDSLTHGSIKSSTNPIMESVDDERNDKPDIQPIVKAFTAEDSDKTYDPLNCLDRLSKNPSGFESLELFSASDDDEKPTSDKSVSEKVLSEKSSLNKASSEKVSSRKASLDDDSNSDKRHYSIHTHKYAAFHDDDDDENKINKMFVATELHQMNKTQDPPSKETSADISVPPNVHVTSPLKEDNSDPKTRKPGNTVSLIKASKGLFRVNENKGDDDDDDVGDVVASVAFGKKLTHLDVTSPSVVKDEPIVRENTSNSKKEKSTQIENTITSHKEKSTERESSFAPGKEKSTQKEDTSEPSKEISVQREDTPAPTNEKTTKNEKTSAAGKKESTRKEESISSTLLNENSPEKDDTPPAVLKEILKDESSVTGSKIAPIVVEETEALPPTTNDKISPLVFEEGNHVIQSTINRKLSPAVSAEREQHSVTSVTDSKMVPVTLGDGSQTFSTLISNKLSSAAFPSTTDSKSSSQSLRDENQSLPTTTDNKILPVVSGGDGTQIFPSTMNNKVAPVVLNDGGQIVPFTMNNKISPVMLGGGGQVISSSMNKISPVLIGGGNQLVQASNIQPLGGGEQLVQASNIQPIVIEGAPPVALPGQPTILRPIVFKEGSKISTTWVPSNFQSILINQAPSFVDGNGGLTSASILVNTTPNNKTSVDREDYNENAQVGSGKSKNKPKNDNTTTSRNQSNITQKQPATDSNSRNILKSENIQFTPDVQSNYSRFLGITEETSPLKSDNYTNEFDLQFSKEAQKNHTRFIGVKEEEHLTPVPKIVNISLPFIKAVVAINTTKPQLSVKESTKNSTRTSPSIFTKGQPKLQSPLDIQNASKVIVKNENVQFTPDVQSNYSRFLGVAEVVAPLKTDNYTNEKDISFTKASQRNYTRFIGIPDPTPIPTPPTAPAPLKSSSASKDKESKPILSANTFGGKSANITKIVSGSSVVVIPVVPVARLVSMPQMMVVRPQSLEMPQSSKTPQSQKILSSDQVQANTTTKMGSRNTTSEDSGEVVISQELSALGQRKKHKEVLNNKVDDDLTKTKLVHDRNGIEGDVFYNDLSEKMALLGPPDHKNYFINKEKNGNDNKAQVSPGFQEESVDSIKNKDDSENIEKFLEWEKSNSLPSLHNESDSADDDSIQSLSSYGKLAPDKANLTFSDTAAKNMNADPIQSLARLASFSTSQSINATEAGVDQQSRAVDQSSLKNIEKMANKTMKNESGNSQPFESNNYLNSEKNLKIDEGTEEYSKVLKSVAKGMKSNEIEIDKQDTPQTPTAVGGVWNPIVPAAIENDLRNKSSDNKELMDNNNREQNNDLQMFSSEEESATSVISKDNATSSTNLYHGSKPYSNILDKSANQKSQSIVLKPNITRQSDYDIIKDIASSVQHPNNSTYNRTKVSQAGSDNDSVGTQSSTGSAEDTFFKNYASFLRLKPSDVIQPAIGKNDDNDEDHSSSHLVSPSSDSLSSLGFNFGGESFDDIAVQDVSENEKDLENVHALYSLHSFLSKLGTFVRKLRRFKKKMHSFCAPLANFCATLAGLPPRFPRLWRVLCGPITKTCAPFGHLYDNLHAFARALRSSRTNQTLVQ